MKLLIGKGPDLTRFPFPDDGGFVPAGTAEVNIEAVVAYVEFPAGEPLGVREPLGTGPVPGFEPVKVFGFLSPEGEGIFIGFGVDGWVIDIGLGLEPGGRRKADRTTAKRERTTGRSYPQFHRLTE